MEAALTIDESSFSSRSATLLFPIDSTNHGSEVQGMMDSFLSAKKGDAVYLTMNKPATSLADLFREMGGQNRLLFVDAISVHTGEKKEMENAFFVSFPGDLTGMMMVLSRTLKMHDFKFIFFDSIPSLLVYNDERTATRFLHAVSAMCKQHSVQLVLLSGDDLPESFTNAISAIVPQNNSA